MLIDKGDNMKKVWKLSGIPVEATFTYTYLEHQCREYEYSQTPLLNIEVTQTDIEFERISCIDDIQYPDEYLESLAFYRKFAEKALSYNVLLMHGSAISYHGRAYIYTAPSGTGKSTHTMMCQKVFGNEVGYINDDKPLLRKIDGIWHVFGTPWDGKHHLSANACFPLGGICVLTRGEKNIINRIDYLQRLGVLMEQIHRPPDSVNMKKALDLMLSLGKTSFWRMRCNISNEAAAMSLGTMGDQK